MATVPESHTVPSCSSAILPKPTTTLANAIASTIYRRSLHFPQLTGLKTRSQSSSTINRSLVLVSGSRSRLSCAGRTVFETHDSAAKGIAAVAWVFFYACYPETRGRTLEDMEVLFGKLIGWRSALKDEQKKEDVHGGNEGQIQMGNKA